MEVQLNNIIEKIRKEGVDDAKIASDEMIAKAKNEADTIIEKAKKEAESLVAEAKKEIERFRENSNLAIKQAARDGELLLKGKITDLFDRVFKAEVAQAMDPDFVKGLILKIVEQWGKDVEAEVEVSEDEKKALEAVLFKGLAKEKKESITLKTGTDVEKGFRIGVKGEDIYYDFSDESIAGILKSYLNPRLNEILDAK